MPTFKSACLHIISWMYPLLWILFIILTLFAGVQFPKVQSAGFEFSKSDVSSHLNRFSSRVASVVQHNQNSEGQQLHQVAPHSAKPAIENLLSLLTEAEFLTQLNKLTGETAVNLNNKSVLLETRYTFSMQIDDAQDYLYQYYTDLGIDVRYVDWEYEYYDQIYMGRNVVAEIPGTQSPEQVWLVGGHFDSTSETPRIKTPGANNNGSGTALTMLIAKVLANTMLEDTIRFVHFSGGEQGGWGSQAYVQSLLADPQNVPADGGRQIMGYINLDGVGWSGSDHSGIAVDLHIGHDDRSLEMAAKFEQANTVYQQGFSIQTKISDASNSSDHASFLQGGYPALWMAPSDSTGTDGYPYARTTNDTVDKIDAKVATQYGQTVLSVLAEVAGIDNTDIPATPFESPTDCDNIVLNGDFDAVGGWQFGAADYPAAISTDLSRSGAYALRLGLPEYTENRQSESPVWQSVSIPDSWDQAILRYWAWVGYSGARPDGQDYSEGALLNSDQNVLQTLESESASQSSAWVAHSVDLSAYVGQEVQIYFNVVNDGNDEQLWHYIDDLTLSQCSLGQGSEAIIATPVIPSLDDEPSQDAQTTSTVLSDMPTRIVLEPTATRPTETFTPIFTASPTPSATLNPTVTPTMTPRPTPTKIPTPVEGVDLIAHHLEITQGVQNLYNSVRLVEGKRTFVRFHVFSNSDDPASNAPDGDRRNGTYWTTARLRVRQGDQERLLVPMNPGSAIAVRANPNRASLNHAFLFELPTEYTRGEITLMGELNLEKSVAEVNYTNNQVERVGTFEFVPPVTLVLIGIGYGDNIYPSDFHRNQLVNWMRQAFPISRLNVIHREYYYADETPTCGRINAYLTTKRFWDVQNGIVPESARYYGLVYDNQGAGFMRGCVDRSPTWVASGPTGSAYWGWWDTDGSYGDWYAGHELGHAYGLLHSNGCGANSAVSGYPHPAGRISTSRRTDDTVYGFNLETWEIYSPEWHDLMTYCPYMWNSDYTYMALMDIFQSLPTLQVVDRAEQERADRLLLNGSFDSNSGAFYLESPFIIPDAFDITEGIQDIAPPVGFDVPTYYAVQFDDQGNELARHPFHPTIAEPGPTIEDPDPWLENDVQLWRINLAVPYVTNTAHVEIITANTTHKIQAGPALPEVSLLVPNGGEIFANELVDVHWTAQDEDGDPLQFNVQYSANEGKTWEMLAQYITDTHLSISARNLASSERAIFRVMASDGVHTSWDQSDETFTVLNRKPTIELRISDKQTIMANQTVALLGTTYDIDTGTMDDQKLQWVSDIDGLLGIGEQLSISDLSVGQHAITLIADDGLGGVVSDTVQLVVMDEDKTLQPEDQLSVAPKNVFLDPLLGASRQRISIDNLNPVRHIQWTATASQPWIWLSKRIGKTSDDLLIGYGDIRNLDAGTHTGVVNIFSPDLPGQPISIPVAIVVTTDRNAMPLVADRLSAETYQVDLDLGAGEDSSLIGLENQNPSREAHWVAEASASWIQLGAENGLTSDDLFFEVDAEALRPGVHSAQIYLHMPNVPEEYIDIRVLVAVPNPALERIYLPTILK